MNYNQPQWDKKYNPIWTKEKPSTEVWSTRHSLWFGIILFILIFLLIIF